MLITVAINVAVGALLCAPALMGGSSDSFIGASLFMSLALLVQLFTGAIMALGKQNKQTGKGMLLAVGILFVIGFAVCSSITVRL